MNIWKFRICLTMISDWHVGSGMGRPGNVDRLIARDDDDLPFVPAKTLHGIWRDACERLCRGLDDGMVGNWSKFVDQIFGSQPALGKNDPTGLHNDPAVFPKESAVQIRSVRIPSPLRELVRSDRLIRQALTFVKPGVKIDRSSGSAQTNYLRFEEVARKETILEADCHLTIDERFREVGKALLITSAKLVERLGGKRRRGLGCCKLEILKEDVDAALKLLENTKEAPEWQHAKDSESPSNKVSVSSQNEPWICVPLVLHLNGPLAISYRTTGNVVETLDFVPGSFLLPHVTRILKDIGLDVRASLQSGDVCVLPAFPEINGECGKPVPMALFAPKGLEKPLHGENRNKVINRLLQVEPKDGTQLKQMREGFVTSTPDKVFITPKTIRTHNTVEDNSQRPTSDVGGVYTYEAIAPNADGAPLVLRSELRIRKSLANKLEPGWQKKLDAEISLGRSKKDDYGSVLLKTENPTEYQSLKTVLAGELFVWLVSDTLIRNSRLRPEPTASCLASELSQRLGVKLNLRDISDNRLNEIVRIRRIDTWHVGWGLPRPSLVALQAGSCIVFKFEGSLDHSKLAQLEAGGIGERTAEGYGQIRFNHPLVSQNPNQWIMHPGNHQNPHGNGTPSKISRDNLELFKFARLLERESWKREIRQACLTFANSPGERKNKLGWVAKGEQGQPPMSQLGGLRGQLALLRSEKDRKQVLDWLVHLEKNSRRKEKWPNIQQVKDLIESEGKIWEIINPDQWPTLTANGEKDLKQELWALAVRTFFDACIRAHKRELEPEQNKKEAYRGA